MTPEDMDHYWETLVASEDQVEEETFTMEELLGPEVEPEVGPVVGMVSIAKNSDQKNFTAVYSLVKVVNGARCTEMKMRSIAKVWDYYGLKREVRHMPDLGTTDMFWEQTFERRNKRKGPDGAR